MIAIQAIDYNIMEKAIVYHFNVLYDEQNWVISKEYGDFVELQEDLASVYSPDQLPYLTGEVRPWARLSADTGSKKLPKLENYLIEAVTTNFEPQLFTVTIPSISDPTKVLRINKSLFDFLDFATHYRPQTPPGSPSGQSPDTTDQPAAVDEDGNVVPQPPSDAAPAKPAGPTKEEIQRKERENEKYQLEAQAKEYKRRIDNSNSTVTTITSQVRCGFESFSIIERDRIDYEIKVGMWGHTWTVEKRYSEFEALHQGMLEIYGTEDANGRGKGLPNFEDSKVPFFRKLEVGTAKSRQRFFRTYFHDLLRIIDTLEPQGLIAGFEITINDADGGAHSSPVTSPNSKGADRRVKVAINKFIFDFLNFQENLDRMTRANANTADKMENIGKVSKEIQEAMVDREKAEKRLKVIRALERRKKTRKPTSDQVIDELADYIPTIQDDVDVLNAIRYFVRNGSVLRDVQHLAKLYPPNSVGESSSLVSTLLGQDGGRVINSPLAVPLAGEELAGTTITFKMGANSKGQGATPAKGAAADRQRKARGKSSFGTTSATGEEGFYTDGEDDDDYDFIDVDHDSGAVFSTSVLKRNATAPVAAATKKVTSLPPKTPTRPIKPDVPSTATTAAPPASKVASTTVGISSLQATRIASAIYFNDTRRDAITILAEALCDDSDWDALFGTLIYYWAECRSDAERVIAEAVAVPV